MNISEALYECTTCTSRFEVTLGRVHCDCGGVLDLRYEQPAYHASRDPHDVGLLRFSDLLPVDASFLRRSSLGLSATPLVSISDSLFVKCDFVSPSGSFKDRGAQVLAAVALSLGAQRIVLDSSGNAGAAMAAHSARIGLACDVVVPASAPAQKLLQSRAYGATVIAIEGERAAATARARDLATAPGTFYASHVENPFFLEGTKTWAFEVAEQLGDAPDEVVMAVGNGSLFIGAYRGFRLLFDQGITTRLPRMVAAQASGWSPLSGDVEHGDAAPLADGIAIVAPRRLHQIAAIINESKGEVRTADAAAIVRAARDLASRGLWVEPTSATAWATLRDPVSPGAARTVVSLGGGGFKSSAVAYA